MEISTIRWLPEHIARMREFQEIAKAYDYLLERAFADLERVFNNQFLKRMDEMGCAMHESILGIIPGNTDTLEDRRRRIQGYYASDLPYTENKLGAVLAVMCGADSFELHVNGAAYRMAVRVIDRDIQLARNVHRIISFMKPANMLLQLYEVYRGEAQQCVRSQASGIRFAAAFYPQFNLSRLHLDSIWKLDGSRKLNGYDGKEPGDLYPVSMGLRAGIMEEIRAAPQAMLLAAAGGRPESVQAFWYRTGAVPDPAAGERARMAVSVAENVRAGGISVNSRNVMDGTWGLNGKRKLNGGSDSR